MLTALTSCILVDRPSHLCELIISNNSDRTFFFGSWSTLSSRMLVSSNKSGICDVTGLLVLGLVFCQLSTAGVTEVLLMRAVGLER